MPYLIIILSILLAGIDQLIKYLVVENLKPISTVEVIPGLFSLTYVENRGAAFGMLSNARWIFILFTLIIIALIIFVLFKYRVNSKLFNIAVILIIGGGIGNLIDRIFYGFVVDYLSVSFFPPVCNFADYCITIGAAIMVIYLLFFSSWFNKDKKDISNG
ncbi:MAG: signal peptidase II [Ruminococcus sp.]|nr:signal peptidase II [Ruminococcus sp.]